MDDSNSTISIEVAYATEQTQKIVELSVPEHTAPREAVRLSGIQQLFPDEDLAAADIGIFGKAIKDDHLLKSGDRIEVYRPLIADPKEVRKRRAAEGKKMKKGGGDA